jgi:hypothetical protein
MPNHALFVGIGNGPVLQSVHSLECNAHGWSYSFRLPTTLLGWPLAVNPAELLPRCQDDRIGRKAEFLLKILERG